MKLTKTFILIGSVIFMFGTGLHAEVILGLQNDSLVEVKPKTCDFQWWKGSKNYNVTGAEKKANNQAATIKK